MRQTINILSVWVDGLNWVVETEPGTYMYIQRNSMSTVENGLNNDGCVYFLASVLDRMESLAIGNTIVIDPSSDVMVRIEPTTG